jgi:hypothetical protein
VFRVADAEKAPDFNDVVPSAIVFAWLLPSAHVARQANRIESTDVAVTVKEIGRPWFVVPTY